MEQGQERRPMDFLRLLSGDEQTPAQASGGDPPAGTALAPVQRANDVDDVRMSRELSELKGLVDALRNNLQEDPLVFRLEVQGDAGEVLPGPKCTLGFELDGCSVQKIFPGGPAFASRQVAEGDTIVEVDGQPATPQNIVGCIIGDDTEGSTCRLRLAKASNAHVAEVLIRRARTDVVQEQELAFDYLSELKNHAVASGDAERALLVENLGRQVVRILLDRQDKELALSVQHKGFQDESLRCLEEIRSGIQSLASHSTNCGADSNQQQIRQLEGEVARHVSVEQEMKTLIGTLERQLESAYDTEAELNQRIIDQRIADQSAEKIQHLEDQLKISLKEMEQAHQLTDQLHASLEQEIGLKKALAERCTELEGRERQRSKDNLLSEEHLEGFTDGQAQSRGLEAQGDDANFPFDRVQAENVRLQDQVYHKEEALWLARQELAAKDKRITDIEQEFEELQQMLNQFNSLSSSKLKAVTEERDQLKSALARAQGFKASPQNKAELADSCDKQTESHAQVKRSEPSAEQAQEIRFLPSPLQTPADKAVSNSMQAVAERKSDEEAVNSAHTCSARDMLNGLPAVNKAVSTSMEPISPDHIRQHAFAGSFQSRGSRDMGILPMTNGPPPPGFPPDTKKSDLWSFGGTAAPGTVYSSDPARSASIMPPALQAAGEFSRRATSMSSSFAGQQKEGKVSRAESAKQHVRFPQSPTNPVEQAQNVSRQGTSRKKSRGRSKSPVLEQRKNSLGRQLSRVFLGRKSSS